VLVTSHDDLVRALDPDVWIVCDFGKLTVRRFARPKCARDVMPACSLGSTRTGPPNAMNTPSTDAR
jgi:hypothetical protein